VIGVMLIDTVPIESVVPYARNPRRNGAAVAKVAASIREFGFRQPIVVDRERVVIVGHIRLLAAQRLGLATVPVHVAEGLTPSQVKAYRLADNRTHEEAEWDEDLLSLELGDLRDLDFDLGLTGFDDDEIARALAQGGEGLTDPDEAPPLPDTPVSRAGDAWVLGRHRLVCGDCTDATTVARALDGVVPHLMVTGPPYGVEYDPAWRERASLAGSGGARGKVMNDDRADWREAWALFPGEVAYVWHGALHAPVVAESLLACGFAIRSQIIWDKTRLVIGRGDYHWQHEPAWYAVRRGRTGHWSGDRTQTTVWPIAHLKSDTGHGTQKPVACMQRPIENNSSPGQAVYDPFCGSGTTIIAAEMSGRACHAAELDPAYVDVTLTRWQAFTGQSAILEASGASFDEVTAERRAGTTINAGAAA
jgi:DNA modification methylase